MSATRRVFLFLAYHDRPPQVSEVHGDAYKAECAAKEYIRKRLVERLAFAKPDDASADKFPLLARALVDGDFAKCRDLFRDITGEQILFRECTIQDST